MKIYKHDKYQKSILLAYPAYGKILGVPFHQSMDKNKWVRSGIGIAIPFYPQEKLDGMECIGDTQSDWDFMIDAKFFDASYLIDKRKK